ncbi:hypothetical protein COU59_03585 [Candidatus Pacearchaeota archaeon CG10_big_fil_rev_8_21_14_0_10_34_12]|nr:MAG: hypothetical protein COU59_03585 [Candidatus Pacearchaeota archaeon CG10_big_fil_rev_8_21_14_0_10_34_12]
MVNKSLIFASAFLVVLMLSFVFAETSGVSENLNDYVKKVAGKKGIQESDIQNVTEVSFDELPSEVDLKNITDADLALYKVESNSGKTSFVITFSDKGYQKITQTDYYTTSFLNFGISEEKNSSTFLKTPSGVSSSPEKGFVMMREGSITGISTSLDVVNADSSGDLQVVIYKNGEQVEFGNSIQAGSLGVGIDYDTQSRGIVTFRPGDLISVYLDINGDVSIKDVTTILEISSKGN